MKNNKMILAFTSVFTGVIFTGSILIASASYFNNKEIDSLTSQFLRKGISAFIPALIYAFFQTGLSEELFFRGFLTKRLINKFGFQLGNSIQVFLFGLLHGALFMMLLNPLQLIMIILITGVAGYLLGWVNEKQSNGSIISSWLIHGIVNTISSTWALFNLI